MIREGRSPVEQDPIHRMAAVWLIRLHDSAVTWEETLEWQRWMSADSRHAEAFRRMEEVWQGVGGLSVALPAEELGADRYDASVPVGEWLASKARSARTPRGPWLRAPLAVAASLLLVAMGAAAVVGIGAYRARVGARVTSIETAVGENRAVRLADGSVVTLGGRTRIEVSLLANSRQITLTRGEALFSVAKDPTRPFRVQVGTATVTAVGTEFNILRGDDRVVVSVLEGRVMVQPVASLEWVSWMPMSLTVGQAAALNAGHSTVVDHGRIQMTRVLSDEASVVGWRQGRLAFEAAPLRDVVEDVNRYARKRIVIADEPTGALMITGTVTNDNIAGWVASLVTTLGIRAEVLPDRIVLRQDNTSSDEYQKSIGSLR